MPQERPFRRLRGGGSKRSRWRVATPVVILLSGTLMVVSYENSDGTDLRPGRYTSLATLVQSESNSYQRLERRVSVLEAQVKVISAGIDDKAVQEQRRRIAALSPAAGLTPQSGAGVTVTLSDSPHDVYLAAAQDPDRNLNELVVHQQDVQAVVNAMWEGGATAVTIQGQRVVSTTGIKCFGNSIRLQGVPYPQPYVISAVGDPSDLSSSIAGNHYLDLYRDQAADPDIRIGYAEKVETRVDAPAYDGLLDLHYAEPATAH